MIKDLSITFHEREVLRQALRNHVEFCKRLISVYSDIPSFKSFVFDSAVISKVLYLRLFHMI